MRLGSSSVSKATYFALLSGSTTSSSLDSEKPAHGITMDHAFNAAHAIDAFLRRTDFQQIVEVENFRLVHQALDRHLPAFGIKLCRCRGHAFLVGRELVEIVVMRDVLKRSLRFIHTKTGGGLRRCWLDESLNDRCVDLAASDRIQVPISDAGGNGAGCQDARPDERPPIKINLGRRHLAAGDFIWLFQRNGNDSNFRRRLAQLA